MESSAIDHVAMVTAVEQSGDGIVITDASGIIEYVNSAFTRMTGYTNADAVGQNCRLLKSGCHPPEFYKELWQTIRSQQVWQGEMINRRKDGTLYTEEMQISPVRTGSGEVVRYIAIKRDVTARRAAEKARRFLAAIVENSEDAIIATTFEGIVLTWNRGASVMFGVTSEKVIGTSVAAFVAPERMKLLAKCFHLVCQGQTVSNYEGICRRKDGSDICVTVTGFPIRDSSGEIVAIAAILRDITDRKRLEAELHEREERLRVMAEERIQFLAYHDALTELPNRSFLRDRLENALASSRRKDKKVGLLFVNLDRFKTINDSYGHSFGDILLRELAKRLKNCVRAPDTVARVGSDEFVIILNEVNDRAEALIAADRMMEALSATFTLQGYYINVGCCIGISLSPEHGTDCETLMRNANAAMCSAKRCGHGLVRLFTDEMNALASQQLTVERNLRFALSRGEFFLVYQPQVHAGSGRITGFEALIRWQQPEMGMVPPDRFISVAESNDLILPIGEWVLRTACAQIKTWQQSGLSVVPVAVNVSAVQFRQEGFCTLVRKILKETGVSPDYLELEFTESLLLSISDETLSHLHELKRMGVKLAIDDFGMGYSNLGYLRQFPVDRLKIDQTFIRDIAVDSGDAAITEAIIALTRSLHLKVIAEGVETEAQMSFLREHQCDEVQGYYFSKPVLADEATSMLQRHHTYPVARDGIGNLQMERPLPEAVLCQ